MIYKCNELFMQGGVREDVLRWTGIDLNNEDQVNNLLCAFLGMYIFNTQSYLVTLEYNQHIFNPNVCTQTRYFVHKQAQYLPTHTTHLPPVTRPL